MNKIFITSFLTLFMITGCAGIKEWETVNRQQGFIELSVAFDTAHYPWILGDKYPQMAVWIQSEEDRYETVFVTLGAGKNKWYFAEERPSALPVWSGIHSKDKHLDIDAVTGATPSGDVYSILWQIPDHLMGKTIAIFIEANVSFDYNEFYQKGIKEDDPLYSDVNGQPSIIWSSSFIIDSQQKSLTPEIVGHGHVLGKNHQIDKDISHITTASELFSYIHIHYYPEGNSVQ